MERSSDQNQAIAMMKKKPWQKILYERQDYPDNYVDDSFLEEMKKNVNTKVYSLSTLVYESGMISQQLSCICIFVAIFIYMDENMVTPSTIFTMFLAITATGYIIISLLNLLSKEEAPTQTGKDLKSVVLFTAFVLGLSPLLKTLTKTISTDTIYAMTVGMLVTNLLFHDYSSDETASISRSPSLNASIFASVCLASRLPTSWHAFVTIMLAMLLFAVVPQIRTKIKNRMGVTFVVATLLLAGVAAAVVTVVSLGFSLALAASQVAILLLFPWWMVRLQRHKKTFHMTSYLRQPLIVNLCSPEAWKPNEHTMFTKYLRFACR